MPWTRPMSSFRVDVTKEVKEILASGGTAETIGYLCIQGEGSRVCGGCTSACDQSVILVFEAGELPPADLDEDTFPQDV